MLTLEQQHNKDFLPRYEDPGQWEDNTPDLLDYERMIEHLEEYGQPVIQSSYYFIRSHEKGYSLCRIMTAGNLFSCEHVDHEEYGISDEDLEFAAGTPGEAFPFEGYFPVSALIITKLEAILV